MLIWIDCYNKQMHNMTLWSYATITCFLAQLQRPHGLAVLLSLILRNLTDVRVINCIFSAFHPSCMTEKNKKQNWKYRPSLFMPHLRHSFFRCGLSPSASTLAESLLSSLSSSSLAVISVMYEPRPRVPKPARCFLDSWYKKTEEEKIYKEAKHNLQHTSFSPLMNKLTFNHALDNTT